MSEDHGQAGGGNVIVEGQSLVIVLGAASVGVSFFVAGSHDSTPLPEAVIDTANL